MIQKINVLGLGYMGLTFALKLAECDFRVIGIDKDSKKINLLKEGIPSLYEPQIDLILKMNLASGNIQFNEKLQPNDDQTCYIVCVGTTINQEKSPILYNLKNSVREVGSVLKKNDLVIIRSTVPVGTTRKIVKPILESESGLLVGDFFLASCPERTLQGAALEELQKLSQIIGGYDENSIEQAANIFGRITKILVRVSSLEVAELIKLLDNTFRDITISIGNLCGKICQELNLDAKEVIESANYGYVRNKILFPGAGVGGGCLVKDPYLLLDSVHTKFNLDLIKSARQINDSMINDFKKLIESSFKKVNRQIKGSRILILGFAFKGYPQTDDIRFSPTIPVVNYLKDQGGLLYGYDPIVSEASIRQLSVQFVDDIYTNGPYDCVVIMNNNTKFRNIDFKKLENSNKLPLLVLDGWYLYDLKIMSKLGIEYKAIGSKING